MPLKITKATDTIEVKTITACIYAIPGIGKSTLGFTANKPLLLDFDHGSYRAKNRGDTVQIDSWADVSAITADDLKPYSTLVIDTAGRALDELSVSIIRENPKMGRGGALTLQGFGELKSRFTGWLKLMRSFGLDVVLVVHADEQRKGDELIERLDIQGGSKNEIYKSSDVMGRICWLEGKRVINFSPTDTAFGKNPAQLPPLEIPHYTQDPAFLGDVLARIKASLNEQSATQTAATMMLADWKAKIEELETVDDFNEFIAGDEKPDELVRANVKRLLGKAARAKGIEFDTKSNAFALKKAAAA